MNGLQDVSDGEKYIYYVMQYHPKLLVKASFLTYLCMKNKYAKIITEQHAHNKKLEGLYNNKSSQSCSLRKSYLKLNFE